MTKAYTRGSIGSRSLQHCQPQGTADPIEWLNCNICLHGFHLQNGYAIGRAFSVIAGVGSSHYYHVSATLEEPQPGAERDGKLDHGALEILRHPGGSREAMQRL